MKKWRNLFDKITDLDNIILAHNKARKNKTSRADVRMVDKDVVSYCKQIQQMLINETYVTSEYHTFKLYEPKERIIFKLPYYPDRIIHHAIMNILEPLWLNQMIPQTYSCIKNRGIHKALKDIRQDLKDRENTKYCLKLDVRKFYPSIDHDILKQIIRIKIADNRLLRLLDSIIDSADGVPIGNYLSQFFANLYLAYFDRWIKEIKHVKYYYRYADDIVMLHGDKQFLHELFLEIKQYLQELKLDIKPNYQVFLLESRGLSFVGYVIRHDYCLVRKNIKQSFIRKNNKLKKLNINYNYYRRKMASYLGWFCHADCINLMIKYFIYKELLQYLERFKQF